MDLRHMRPSPAELAASDQYAAEVIANPGQMSQISDTWEARYSDVAQWRRIRFAATPVLLRHLRDVWRERNLPRNTKDRNKPGHQ